MPLQDVCDISEDDELENRLKESNISSLLKKFQDIGVTSEILWDVTDDILENGGFTEVEIIRYKNARQTNIDQMMKGKGKSKTFLFFQTIF